MHPPSELARLGQGPSPAAHLASLSTHPRPATPTLAVVALGLAAASAGFALCMNIVHYRTWRHVGEAEFAAFQSASGARTIPAALALGVPTLVLGVRLARRGLGGAHRTRCAVAVAIGAIPWIATPILFVPLQARLHRDGPSPDLLAQLSWADLVLRAIPPIVQTVVLATALTTHLRHSSGAAAVTGAAPARDPR